MNALDALKIYLLIIAAVFLFWLFLGKPAKLDNKETRSFVPVAAPQGPETTPVQPTQAPEEMSLDRNENALHGLIEARKKAEKLREEFNARQSKLDQTVR